MKRSISNKINRLIIISLVSLSIFMIGINLVIINHHTSRNSEIMMKQTCSAQALQLDKQFNLVEQSVQNIYDISEKMRPSIDELSTLEKTNAYINQFKEFAITIADNTEGAISVYYRINPDINANGMQGFFYVKSPETGLFEATELTDILEYDVNDVEHVGWYYVPVWAGRPVWMEPYHNANIGVGMISYVVPIYDGNDLIGVVGMDVDFDRLKNITEDVNIYNSSGAVLSSMDSSQVYYNRCDIFGEQLPSGIYHMIQGAESSEKMISYEINGEQYGVHYETLDNRMKLIVYAKKSDINREAFSSILVGGIIFAVIFAITLLIFTRVSRRIVGPIGDITEVAKKYAAGDWDAKVYCDTDDELKVLTDNITIMAEKTREYIDYIQDMAKKDALTGLGNKMGYLMYVDKINNEYIGTDKEFAVVVFDVNNLKVVNDNMGHEKGDELVIAASKFICKFFPNSPVFRVGGDEFVAIVDSDDYKNRNELIGKFRKHMKLTKNSEDWTEVSIACGMSTYRIDGESYDEIFSVADQRMYKNKTDLKGGIEPR